MSRTPEPRRCIAPFLLEAGVWLLPSALFLWIYIGRLGGSPSAVLPHLKVILAVAAAAVLVRGMVRNFLGPAHAALAGAIVTAACLSVLWLYYVLAVVGFAAWGYLVSWALIVTYIHQAPYMVGVLGLGLYAVPVLAAAVFLAVAAALHAFYRRWDWLAGTAGLSPMVAGAGVLAALTVLGLFTWRYVDLPPTQAGEPLALTFWPPSFERKFQSNMRPQAGPLQAKERSARAAYGTPQPRPGTNVVLIVVDGLRARSMGVYGYSRPTTPFLSDMVRKGVAARVDRAYAACAESSCGLMAIGSSRFIHQLVDDPITLTEVLRLHGYRAHMVLSGDHTFFYGLRKAYGTVDTFFDGRMSGAYYNDDAHVLEALRRLDLPSRKGHFIQVHLMSAHILGRRKGAGAGFGTARSYATAIGGLPVSAREREEFLNFYDGGVAQTDETIAGLLQILRGKGLLDDALVVVTADHGEFVGERGEYGHAKGVYGEVLDVPLLLMAFGKAAPLRIEQRPASSQVDIAPTVLAHLGLPVPASWSGVPLQAPAPGPEREIYFQQNGEFGLVGRGSDGRTWKYWVDASSGREFAFDTEADPGEIVNLASAIAPADRARWRASLRPLEVVARESANAR